MAFLLIGYMSRAHLGGVGGGGRHLGRANNVRALEQLVQNLRQGRVRVPVEKGSQVVSYEPNAQANMIVQAPPG